MIELLNQPAASAYGFQSGRRFYSLTSRECGGADFETPSVCKGKIVTAKTPIDRQSRLLSDDIYRIKYLRLHLLESPLAQDAAILVLVELSSRKLSYVGRSAVT